MSSSHASKLSSITAASSCSLLSSMAILLPRYLPAIYDPSTHQVTIQPAIPTYVLAQRVKRTKLSNMHTTHRESDLSHMAKRDVLGEAFGTRKAKSRIRANERNKVDATAQESVRDHLMAAIEEAAKTSAAPSKLRPISMTMSADSPGLSTFPIFRCRGRYSFCVSPHPSAEYEHHKP
jgi:hypothetical protein